MAQFLERVLTEPLTARGADDVMEAILREAVHRRAKTIYLISTRSSFVLKLRRDHEVERVHHFSLDDKEKLLESLGRMAHTPDFDGYDDELDAPWGRISRQFDENVIDFRVTFLPCELGKDVAIQVTYPDGELVRLDQIFSDANLQRRMLRELRASYGLYVVSGPPFSGKTTTAWAMLQEMNTELHRIISIESPIRRLVPGVSQIEVQSEGSPDYADALQAIRYHHPDAVFVDALEDDLVLHEILRTVNRGYRVVANTVTGDVAETLAYLRDLRDVSRPMYRSLRVVTAQRLFPRIDQSKAERVDAPDWVMTHPAVKDLPEPRFFEQEPHEDDPARQVVPVYEVLIVDEDLRQFLKRGPTEEEIRDHLVQLPDFDSLRSRALRLAADGVISLTDALDHTPPDIFGDEDDDEGDAG